MVPVLCEPTALGPQCHIMHASSARAHSCLDDLSLFLGPHFVCSHRVKMSTLSPTPIHLIRSHTSAVSSVSISQDNERIYSGDSAGLVVITSTRSLRSLASWNAHTDNVLGVEEWEDQLITSVYSLALLI